MFLISNISPRLINYDVNKKYGLFLERFPIIAEVVAG